MTSRPSAVSEAFCWTALRAAIFVMVRKSRSFPLSILMLAPLAWQCQLKAGEVSVVATQVEFLEKNSYEITCSIDVLVSPKEPGFDHRASAAAARYLRSGILFLLDGSAVSPTFTDPIRLGDPVDIGGGQALLQFLIKANGLVPEPAKVFTVKIPPEPAVEFAVVVKQNGLPLGQTQRLSAGDTSFPYRLRAEGGIDQPDPPPAESTFSSGFATGTDTLLGGRFKAAFVLIALLLVSSTLRQVASQVSVWLTSLALGVGISPFLHGISRTGWWEATIFVVVLFGICLDNLVRTSWNRTGRWYLAMGAGIGMGITAPPSGVGLETWSGHALGALSVTGVITMLIWWAVISPGERKSDGFSSRRVKTLAVAILSLGTILLAR